MSKLLAKLAGMLSNRTMVGADKAGNRYFARTEQIDGIMKEKRWVVFKRGEEQDPTSVPVEWICWLNGQRKRAPTPEELADLEAKRERVKLNVAKLKKQEDEQKKAKVIGKATTSIGKTVCPDLKSFIQQFPNDSKGNKVEEEASDSKVTTSDTGSKQSIKEEPESSEPTGSGQSFRPGTWQPPT